MDNKFSFHAAAFLEDIENKDSLLTQILPTKAENMNILQNIQALDALYQQTKNVDLLTNPNMTIPREHKNILQDSTNLITRNSPQNRNLFVNSNRTDDSIGQDMSFFEDNTWSGLNSSQRYRSTPWSSNDGCNSYVRSSLINSPIGQANLAYSDPTTTSSMGNNIAGNRTQLNLQQPSAANKSADLISFMKELSVKKEDDNILPQNKSFSLPSGPLSLLKGCVFCKNNGQHLTFYNSHTLKGRGGICTCPVLRTYVCPLCGGTEDEAHTIKYCPKNAVTRGNPIAVGLPPGKVTNWRDVALKLAVRQYL